MANEPISDEPTVEIAERPEPPKPRGRALVGIFALVGFVGCAVLGALLHQAHEREGALSAALSASEYERSEALASLQRARNALDTVTVERDDALRTLDSTRNTLRTLATERDDLRSMLRQTEFARDSATRSLSFARDEVTECNEALEQAVSIARSHRDKLDEIASAIRIGMIRVADIPDEGFVFSGGYDLESEYRKVVKKYNDLVDRFNAAIERSNDLGEIVNRVVNILRS